MPAYLKPKKQETEQGTYKAGGLKWVIATALQSYSCCAYHGHYERGDRNVRRHSVASRMEI